MESCIALQKDNGSVLDNRDTRYKRKERTDKTVKRIQELVQEIQKVKYPVLSSSQNF
jgi:hypothetical protein